VLRIYYKLIYPNKFLGKIFFVICVLQWKILPIKIGEYLKQLKEFFGQLNISNIILTYKSNVGFLTINSHELKNGDLFKYWSNSHGFKKLIIKP
jgi:hypothetical protein